MTGTDTTQITLRGIVVLAASALALLLGAVAPMQDQPRRAYADDTALDEELEEELEGIAGRDRVLVNTPGTIEAAFALESYRPGERATLRFFVTARDLTLRVFHSGPEGIRTRTNDMMFGVEVGRRRTIRSVRPGTVVTVRVGEWPSGLYFVRLSAPGGRLGFAPFVVAPRRLGEHPIAVVMPTNTWKAYNVRDDDRDGVGDSWYADKQNLTIPLARPFLSRGVPFRFRVYDLPFLRWLDRTGREVDVISDLELHRTSGADLRRAYRLIVFPGHHEYVTTAEYDAITTFRNLGGNLAFLSANNFFWRVDRRAGSLTRIDKWRNLGRPEASLIGVQYIGNDNGQARGPWVVRATRHTGWMFAGTGRDAGGRLTNGGIEIDAVSSSSPRGTTVVAQISDLLAPGMHGQMTYYETARGARVFAAGAFTLAGASLQPPVKQLLANVWQRLGGEANLAVRVGAARSTRRNTTSRAESLPTASGATLRAVPILMYHVIAEPPRSAPFPDLYVPRDELRAQVNWLHRHGYEAVTLQQVYDSWHGGATLPKRPIVISFDDGYRSHITAAFPILRAHGWPGVLNLDLSNLAPAWGLPPGAVRRLIASGWEIDAHSLTHPDVSRLSGAALAREVGGSREEIRRRFGVAANFFCYPAGRFDAEAVTAVRDAGYLGATTTEHGLARPSEPFTLDRVRISSGDGAAGLARKLRDLGVESG